jgi:hypothetical protein
MNPKAPPKAERTNGGAFVVLGTVVMVVNGPHRLPGARVRSPAEHLAIPRGAHDRGAEPSPDAAAATSG